MLRINFTRRPVYHAYLSRAFHGDSLLTNADHPASHSARLRT
jgi:hypothetical protein